MINIIILHAENYPINLLEEGLKKALPHDEHNPFPSHLKPEVANVTFYRYALEETHVPSLSFAYALVVCDHPTGAFAALERLRSQVKRDVIICSTSVLKKEAKSLATEKPKEKVQQNFVQ